MVASRLARVLGALAIWAGANEARAEDTRSVITSLGAIDVVLTRMAGAPESDERPSGDLVAVDARGREVVLARGVTDAGLLHAAKTAAGAPRPGELALFAVDRTRTLVRLDVAGLDIPGRGASGRDRPGSGANARVIDVRSTVILDGVLGAPIVLADGSIVVSRLGDEPGESDLWLVPPTARGGEARAVFEAPGADDRPTLLSDGRVLFVSTRSTIASLWIGDLARGEARALTNAGLRAGRGTRAGFVPPPHGAVIAQRGHVLYDAGEGWWSVDLATGRGARLRGDGGR